MAKRHEGSRRVAEAFDEIAEVYDSHFSLPVHLAENNLVASEVQRFLGYPGCSRGLRLLDIGCGTGFLLDLIELPSSTYTGTDISLKMLKKAQDKFPGFAFVEHDIESSGVLPSDHFTHAISLFGSLSYCHDLSSAAREIERILVPGGKCFLMFFSERYIHRKSHIMANDGVAFTGYSKDDLRATFKAFTPSVRGMNIFGDSMQFLSPHLLPLEYRTVSRVFPDWGYVLIIEGQKK